MRTAVVGAGPTGLYTAIALARRGHEVTVVDRDPGPEADGTWPRRGVMQFHHPHAFRAHVVEALLAETPEVWDDLLAAGAEPAHLPGPDGRAEVVAVRCRRLTFERVLRAAAEREPGVALRTGHVDEVRADRDRAAGVVVDGRAVDADLVVDASGRAGRLGRGRRAPALAGGCGIAYTSRQYRLEPGADPGPMNSVIGLVELHPGYQAIVFPHDGGVLVFVGDTVCTTNPAVGRGVATSLMQARELVHLLGEHPGDPGAATLAFDRWCAEQIEPWFHDHVHWDAEQARRWAGHDIDLDRPLPSDLVVAATAADPSLFAAIGPYLAMRALPASLDPVRPRVREIYPSGWRPPVPEGPTRDELAELVTAALR